MDQEELHQIPGYDDYYVTKAGRVFKDNWHNTGECRELSYNLSQSSKNKFYRTVSFRVNGKLKVHRVARLVMMTFVGGSDAPVRHLNGDSTDDRLINLEYSDMKQIHGRRNNKYLVTDLKTRKSEVVNTNREVAKLIGKSHAWVLRHGPGFTTKTHIVNKIQ